MSQAGKQKIILVGGGGHCNACIDVIESTNAFTIEGILDITEKVGKNICGYPVTGNDDLIPGLAAKQYYFLITTGQLKSASKRVELFDLVQKAKGRPAVVISPNAYVSKRASLGAGTICMHHSMVSTGVQTGVNCIINTKALVEHDCMIGDHCHISTGAVINGGCTVGNAVFIGSNAVLAQGITVADNVTIGAGSVVINDITEPGVYAGNPAKKKN